MAHRLREAPGTLGGVVPCAYLRVYQPLDAFPSEERSLWERYILEGHHVRPSRPRYLQRQTTGRLGVIAQADGERAEVILVNGEYFVCPWRTRLRVLASMLSFREVQPLELSEQFVPDDEAERAERELAKLRRKSPDEVAFLHQAPWHVPVRWFALFEDAERLLSGDADGGYRLRYLTDVHKAMGRAERAIPILRGADLSPVAEMIAELHEWLSSFAERSVLELDYAGLCELLTWDELDDDHTAREIGEALDALSMGELPRSAEIYQGVLGRWAEVRSREQMN